MAKIGIEIEGEGKRIIEEVGDLSFNRWGDVLKQFGYSFRAGMAGLFANTAGRVNSKLVDGPNWQPLNKDYADYKKKNAPSGVGTLVWYGGLGGSFITEGDSYNISNINGKTAEFGSNHPLAKFHQDGHSRGWFPARPIIFDSPKRNSAFRQILSDYLRENIKAKGLKVEEGK